jgi:hypothetical protein
MPFYMTQSKLSKDAIQALIAKPQDRSGPIDKLIKSVGGKLHHYSSPSVTTRLSSSMKLRTTPARRRRS